MGTCITKIKSCEGNIDLYGLNIEENIENIQDFKTSDKHFVIFNDKIIDSLAEEYFFRSKKNLNEIDNLFMDYTRNKNDEKLNQVFKNNFLRRIICLQSNMRNFLQIKENSKKIKTLNEILNHEGIYLL